MEPTLAQTAATALTNAGLASVAGLLVARFWLMKCAAAWQEPAFRRLCVAMPAALAACMTGMVLSLWAQSAAMADVAWRNAWPAFAEMLASTHYGHAGVAVAALLAVAMLIHLRLQRAGPRYVAILALLFLLIAAARVSIGHAFDDGPWRAAVWVEWLHLLCMSLWTGIVFVSGWLVLPCVAAKESVSEKTPATYLKPMSDWAFAALAGVLATGVYNAYRVLGNARDLIDSDYGLVLVFKLCFVLLAIALGGCNKFVGLPAALSLQPAKAQRGLRAVIAILRIESIALLLVLAGAAVLTNSEPPG